VGVVRYDKHSATNKFIKLHVKDILILLHSNDDYEEVQDNK